MVSHPPTPHPGWGAYLTWAAGPPRRAPALPAPSRPGPDGPVCAWGGGGAGRSGARGRHAGRGGGTGRLPAHLPGAARARCDRLGLAVPRNRPRGSGVWGDGQKPLHSGSWKPAPGAGGGPGAPRAPDPRVGRRARAPAEGSKEGGRRRPWGATPRYLYKLLLRVESGVPPGGVLVAGVGPRPESWRGLLRGAARRAAETGLSGDHVGFLLFSGAGLGWAGLGLGDFSVSKFLLPLLRNLFFSFRRFFSQSCQRNQD